jgi:hypothetical protein
VCPFYRLISHEPNSAISSLEPQVLFGTILHLSWTDNTTLSLSLSSLPEKERMLNSTMMMMLTPILTQTLHPNRRKRRTAHLHHRQRRARKRHDEEAVRRAIRAADGRSESTMMIKSIPTPQRLRIESQTYDRSIN